MHKNLENYLEEISHYLSGRTEREEILSEIRSHILEKAEQESGPVSEASLEKVIAAYGRPRQVAEKYLDDRPVIAPTFKRLLFRYTALFFAIHLVFIVFAVIFKKSLIIFPFFFMPRLGVIEAVMYLPAAFLTDFGIVALVLYFITQSGRDFKLPWPKFALDLDEVKAPDAKTLAAKIATMVGAGIMLALTGVAVKLFIKFQTIFLVSYNLENFRPLLLPRPGRRVSLIVIIMLAAGTIGLFIKVFALSRRITCWVDAIADSLALVLIGLLLRQQYTTLFAIDIQPAFLAKIHLALTFTLLFVALMIAIDLVSNLVRLGRKRLAK
ncbi:MAG: hypothetical protein L6428_10790 [Candidatus Aminicenantes bacterium]|nr:hypothetical protein [Acidobacteriota bacterium]MCG2811926.1 hypothetical protein [Candidatus Aminicenantes bacterium]